MNVTHIFVFTICIVLSKGHNMTESEYMEEEDRLCYRKSVVSLLSLIYCLK